MAACTRTPLPPRAPGITADGLGRWAMDYAAVPAGRMQTRAAAPRRSVAPPGWLAAAVALTVVIAMTVAAAAAEVTTETVTAAAGVQDRNMVATTAEVLDTSVRDWYSRCGSRYDMCSEAVRCHDGRTNGCYATETDVADKCCSCYEACKKSWLPRRKYKERCRTRSRRFGRTC